MRISRYTVILFISLFVSPIFFSQVVANDHRFIDDELISNKVIDDGTIMYPNNPIMMYHCWSNLVANERVAYRSTSQGFEILNTSNPETIEVLNEFHLGENLSSGYLALNDTFLYLSVNDYDNWSFGFSLFDVANHEITSISQFFFNASLNGFYCNGLYVKGNYIYCLINQHINVKGGLVIVDYTNITHPELLGSYFFDGIWFQDFAINNNYAYLLRANYFGDFEDGFLIIDLTNTTSLVKVGEITDETNLRAVTCWDNKLFLVSQDDGLRIYDLTDPVNPQRISNYSEADGYFQDICILDDIAYIVTSSGCCILDISEITAPERIGLFKYTKELGAFSYGLLEDDLLYLHKNSEDPTRMLFILDVTNPEKPVKMYPAWIGPQWARNEFTLFMVSTAIALSGIVIISVSIFLIVKRRRRRKK